MTRSSAAARPTRIFACDIDGCLAEAGHVPYDLDRLSRMAALNRLSRSDPDVPALTLVTGRPHGYVDAVMQLLHIDLPVSFENGAGFATRKPYSHWWAPEAAAGLSGLREFAAAVEAVGGLQLQPGKQASLSVFPLAGRTRLEDVSGILGELLVELGLSLVLDPSTDCVNVLLAGCDKASGFAHLCRELGCDPSEVAGIGDSVGDREWLEACGISVAPGNAAPEVRAIATRHYAEPDVAAALAAYEWLIERNRSLRTAS